MGMTLFCYHGLGFLCPYRKEDKKGKEEKEEKAEEKKAGKGEKAKKKGKRNFGLELEENEERRDYKKVRNTAM